MHAHAPGLALLSSLATVSAALFSRFRIPADDVTVNWSSVFLPNQTKTGVKQETVLAWARLLLIVARPNLHIATVLHACSLPVVVSQVPIINFCVDFMSITSISITACSLGLQLFFDLLYLGVKLVPLLLCLQRGLIRLRSACLYDL